MTDSKEIWIQKGYQIFSDEGPDGNRISRLAKILGRNKSAFYHYFATVEIFTAELLDLHLRNASVMAKKMKVTETLNDLIDILIQHKVDLLFNRQLRVNRQKAEFEVCFSKTNQFVGDSIMPLWSNIIGLEGNSYLSRMVLQLSIENFMLKTTSQTLNRIWLEEYFVNLQLMIKKLKDSE